MAGVTDLDALEQWAAEENESSPPASQPKAASTVAVPGSPSSQRSARTDPPARALRLSSPSPSQGRPGKRGRTSEHGDREKKKQKSGKVHGQHRSPKLDLLGLSDQDCARFKEEPFEVMAEVMKAAGTLLKKYQEGEADRLEGRRLAHRFSLLEDTLIDKNFKLKSALSLLAEVRGERDSLLQKLKELEPQIQAVALNDQKLKEAEEEIVSQVAARTAAEAARAEAEAARDEAEAARVEAVAARDRAVAEKAEFEREAEKEVGRLTSLNKDLFAQIASLKGDLSAIEQDRDKYQGRFKELLDRAKGAAELQFENAVKQIKLLNPGLVIDPNLVSSSHRVVEQEIVLPEKTAKGKVVQERAVIFRAPDA